MVNKLHVNAMRHKANAKFIIHNQICNFQKDESKVNVRKTEYKKKQKDTNPKQSTD